MSERMGFLRICPYWSPPVPLPWDCPHMPRVLIRRNKKWNGRLRLPVSIRCNTCENYISEGTKFRSRNEQVVGETSLGINVFRCYFKCPKCSIQLTIKKYPHDPKCVVESGATTVAENEKRKGEAEEMVDVMNPSQQRTCTLPDLDETKSIEATQLNFPHYFLHLLNEIWICAVLDGYCPIFTMLIDLSPQFAKWLQFPWT